MAILITVVVSIATLSFFIYTEVFFQKDVPSAEEGLQELHENVSGITLPEIYNLKKLIINIKSPNKRLRFLEITPHLVVFKPEYKDEMEKNEATIKDQIIYIASHMTPIELNTIAGKTLLENRIQKSINNGFHRPLIKKIFFSRFVIQ